ncbi:MAG TPA: chemotaxis protein CheB [Actinomycetes bacterium]|nr:chemotaxis protein CheB [Actinomycetes bacterium]
MAVRTRNLVVVGASAGGVEALQRLMTGLPERFPAAMAVVLHVSAQAGSALSRILDRVGVLPVVPASDRLRITPSVVVVAPPDRHLMVEGSTYRLSGGPRQHGHRPAVDPLFKSAAIAAGANVIGVVLSGSLDDGAAGAAAIARAGGLIVVQDPEEAPQPGMPRAAKSATGTDLVMPIGKIAEFLVSEVGRPVDLADRPNSEDLRHEVNFLLGSPLPSAGRGHAGKPTTLMCPECGGALFHAPNQGVPHFRCWVGHSWSAESLLDGQRSALEAALWSAVRALEERANLNASMAQSARERGYAHAARRFEDSATGTQESAQALRKFVENVHAYDSADATVDEGAADQEA